MFRFTQKINVRYIFETTQVKRITTKTIDRGYRGTGVYLAGFGLGEVMKDNQITGRHNPYLIGKIKKSLNQF